MNTAGLKDHMRPFIDLIKESGAAYFWIASGAIRDYFVGNEPVDVDFFFPDIQSMTKACEHLKKNNFKKIKDLPRGYKFSIQERKYVGNSIDLICWDGTGDPPCIAKTPKDTMGWFDFTVEMAALDSNGNFFIFFNFFEDCKNKRLVRNSISDLYPRGNNRRLLKYIKNGYTIDQENLLIWLQDQEATFAYRFDFNKKKVNK